VRKEKNGDRERKYP